MSSLPSTFVLLDSGAAIALFEEATRAVVLSPSGLTCFLVSACGLPARHLTRFVPAAHRAQVLVALEMRNAFLDSTLHKILPPAEELGAQSFYLSSALSCLRWPPVTPGTRVVESLDGFASLDRGSTGFEMSGVLLVPRFPSSKNSSSLIAHARVKRQFTTLQIPQEFAWPVKGLHRQDAAYVAVDAPPCTPVDAVDDSAFYVKPWIHLVHTWLSLPSLDKSIPQAYPSFARVMVTPDATYRVFDSGQAEAILRSDGSSLVFEASLDSFTYRAAQEDRIYASHALPRLSRQGDCQLRSVGALLKRLLVSKSRSSAVESTQPPAPTLIKPPTINSPATTDAPLQVLDARFLPGIGRFSFTSDGRAVVVFEDRTVVRLTSDGKSASVLRRDGTTMQVTADRPLTLDRYLDVTLEYQAFMRLPTDKRRQVGMDWRANQQSVVACLERSENAIRSFVVAKASSIN